MSPGFKMRLAQVSKNLTKLLDIKSMKLLDNYAQFNPSPLSMKQMLDFGRGATEVESYQFLRREIPVRLSNIMKEINLLPSSLLQMPSILLLQEWYAQSFRDLCTFEGRDGDQETLDEFCRTLIKITDRHNNVVQTMAQGVLELKDSHAVDMQTEMSIQYFLDRFYMSRISIRMLMHQHTTLFEPDADRDTEWRVGMIDPHCKVATVVQDAFDKAAFLCEEYYSCAPDLEMTVHNYIDPGKPLEVVYPPSHLQHIFFELFKNSMRAVVEHKQNKGRGGGGGGGQLPDIQVLLAKGPNDLTIKVSDQGGGIPRHVTDRLFKYLYSTAPRPSMTPTKAPLAGYGYGLPLSRLYARYFHGDLILNSYEGYGTDTVIFLKAATHEANELLPIFNKTSSKQYKAAVPTADWTDATSSMNTSFRGLVAGTSSSSQHATSSSNNGGGRRSATAATVVTKDAAGRGNPAR